MPADSPSPQRRPEHGKRAPKNTRVGVHLVRLLAAEGDRIFSTDRARALAPRVGLKDAYVLEALHHLRRNGWIVSIRRGLYALSLTLPGIAPVHEYEIATTLVEPAAVSHWSALHRHGLTQQIPWMVFVLTTAGASIPRAQRDRDGDATCRFVQVKPEFYFGIEKVWVGDARVTITDPERTLLDGLARPRYCGDFAEVLHAFSVRGAALDVDRIIGHALRLDAATVKRLGWVLERQGVELARLDRLCGAPVKGYRRLDPTGPRAGPYCRRWMIQENLPGRVHA